MDLKRFKNYGLWVSVAALIPLVLSGFGIDIIPNYNQVVNSILAILVMAGIISNPNAGRWFKDDKSDDSTLPEVPTLSDLTTLPGVTEAPGTTMPKAPDTDEDDTDTIN